MAGRNSDCFMKFHEVRRWHSGQTTNSEFVFTFSDLSGFSGRLIHEVSDLYFVITPRRQEVLKSVALHSPW